MVILALVVASLVYRILHEKGLEQTSALFIGLPALLAIVMVFFEVEKDPMGQMFKFMTIAILMAGICLAEGTICLLMSAPLFYLVGAVVVLIYEVIKKWQKTWCLLPLAFLPFCLEGVTTTLSFDRNETVVIERVVQASPGEVERVLSAETNINYEYPMFLQLGFPMPIKSVGKGLDIDDKRRISFRDGKGKIGDLVMEVTERRPGYVKFRFTSDTSKIAHWMSWRDAEIVWQEIAPGQTRIVWKIHFWRLLDPAWYFQPLERYTVSLVGEYLIGALDFAEVENAGA
jgi:hypothetical protein